MTAKVIQGRFLGGRPKLLPSVAARLPPPIQAKTAARPPGPPTTAFGSRPPSSPAPAFAARPPGSPTPAFAGRPGAVQRHGAGGAFAVEAGPLGLVSGGGRPLPDAVRGKMEAALGANFSDVRVHVGPQAERIGAIAFTVGSDIYFAPGRFQPDTVHGQQLLGHELAHVVQQRAGRVRNPLGSGLAVIQDHALEAEADRLGQRAAAHRAEVQAKLAPGANLRTNVPVLTLTNRSARYGSDRRSLPTANSPAPAALQRHVPPPTQLGPLQMASMKPFAIAPAASHYARLVQRAHIPSQVRGPAPALAAGGVIQRLILYMQNDLMHQEDAAAIARRRFWWDEANFYWGTVPDLRVNSDSTLSLLGHADQSTFGGLTADGLVVELRDRHFKESTHKTLELIGCGASMTKEKISDTFVDQVQELLNEQKFEKTIVVKGLKQPRTGTHTILYRFDNGKFVYITDSAEGLDKVKYKDIILRRIYGSQKENYYSKFIEYLNN